MSRLGICVLSLAASATLLAQAPMATYRDGRGRFSVSHPVTWGTPGVGTDDGFGDRIAAIKFPNLEGLGGELSLVRGRLSIDIQALGGLYDDISLSALPDAVQQQVIARLTRVTPDSFCRLLGAADHLGNVQGLSATIVNLARRVDRVRNVDPRVLQCTLEGDMVTFHKEATFEVPAGPTRQHIFGAIRFLGTSGEAVQLVRALRTAPSAAERDAIATTIRSFTR